MSHSLFRPEAVNHQRNRLWGDVILAQPLSTKLATAFVGVVLVSLVSYLALGDYTRKERVQGYLVPESGLVQVYPDQQGTATDILVDSGEEVEAGDTLAKITTDRSTGNGSTVSTLLIDVLKHQKSLLTQRIERAEVRREDRRHHLTERISNLKDQIAQLDQQQSLQQERLDLAKQRYASLESLHQEQLMSESDYQDRYQLYLDEQQNLEQLERSLLTEKSNLQSLEFELASLDAETAEEIDQLEAEKARAEQQIIQFDGDSSFTLKAPITGTVTSLQLSIGQRVNPQQPLLAVLPEGQQLEADLFVPTRAIGFLSPGLSVDMRYDAFPYQRFGTYSAEVREVAKTVLSPEDVSGPLRLDEPVYRARARLTHDDVAAYGKDFPLQAGMIFEAHLHLDERPLYQWLLKPLYSLKGTF
ncbi:HlyD family efflux transporter periplasmic adaptor subunit [Marinobacter sp. HL-58]|uniref:HlyD family secretion protein n=1 Tax=Marinobacter sp. HL-58 TaxID=1479237 RepID=UPI0006DA1F31|nr:HlyD family efflux transporter periplasmic adaptor subunit [Marinobacter sp. HL-58]KPQ00263.1 MAG: type I bacteriocin secretion system membrane fusion component RaxA [Marinobacter sp. HL-58]